VIVIWHIPLAKNSWAESSEVFSGTARGGKNIRQKEDHPFILSHNSLKKLLVSLSGNPDMSTTVAGKLAVQLPSMMVLYLPKNAWGLYQKISSEIADHSLIFISTPSHQGYGMYWKIIPSVP